MGIELISLRGRAFSHLYVLQLTEIFSFLPCNLLFLMPLLLSIIGRTLLNFMNIVRCKPNFDLNYCWQHERLAAARGCFQVCSTSPQGPGKSWFTPGKTLRQSKYIPSWNKIWSYQLTVMVPGSCSPCWRRSNKTDFAFTWKCWFTVSSKLVLGYIGSTLNLKSSNLQSFLEFKGYIAYLKTDSCHFQAGFGPN